MKLCNEGTEWCLAYVVVYNFGRINQAQIGLSLLGLAMGPWHDPHRPTLWVVACKFVFVCVYCRMERFYSVGQIIKDSKYFI